MTEPAKKTRRIKREDTPIPEPTPQPAPPAPKPRAKRGASKGIPPLAPIPQQVEITEPRVSKRQPPRRKVETAAPPPSPEPVKPKRGQSAYTSFVQESFRKAKEDGHKIGLSDIAAKWKMRD